MLEEVQEGIVTRRNLAGGLPYPHITGELCEGNIEGTYAEEGVDSSKQNTCQWEGDLARLSRKTHQMVCTTYLAHDLAQDTRESVKDVHCRAEAAYQSPIAITISFKRLLPFLE